VAPPATPPIMQIFIADSFRAEDMKRIDVCQLDFIGVELQY
jgi:hypothetical protein